MKDFIENIRKEIDVLSAKEMPQPSE